jgi:hypothetical protein
MGCLKPTVRMHYPLLNDICNRIIYDQKLIMMFQVTIPGPARAMSVTFLNEEE